MNKPIPSCRRTLKQGLLRCRRGAMALEMAIILPILLLLIVGITELGLIMFMRSVLEGATSITSRTGRTGFAPSGQTREGFIISEIHRRSADLLDDTRLTITILSYNNFENIGQAEPCSLPACNANTPIGAFTDTNGNGVWDADQGRPGAGAGGRVVLYTVTYRWHVFTPIMRELIGDHNGDVLVSAVATVRNEEFPGQ